MKCETDKEQLALYMNNEMTNAERAAFESHLETCAECRHELDANLKLWSQLDEVTVPGPSGNMQVRFDAMLDVYKDSVEEKERRLPGIFEKIKQVFTLQPAFVMAYSVVLIIAGLGIGFLVNHPTTTTSTPPQVATTAPVDNKQIDSLSSQVHEMKEIVMMSLLQNPSASERMRGVSYTSEITHVNSNIITALLTTLNNDPNTNVRLTTLETLTHYAGNPAVREGLIESIGQQDSPLVQSAMADVMLKLQEKRSVEPFKKLLQQKGLNEMVRSKIQETITQLI